MRTLILNKFLHRNGGSETYIFKLGEALEQHGHEVQYFGMEHEGRCVGNRVNAYTSDMDFHGGSKLSKLTYPIKTIYSKEARVQLRKVLDDFKPDVCHLNNFNYQLTPSIILEIVKWRKETGRDCKIIFTAHDYQLVCPNHMLNNPNTHQNCEKCLGGHFVNCMKDKCIHGSTAKSAMIYVFRNYYLYLIVAIVSQITNNIITSIIVSKMYPDYYPKGKLDANTVGSINGRIKDLFIAKFGGVVLNSADTIVISAFLGLTLLAVYQNYYFVMSSVCGIMEILLTSITAGLGNSYITESKEKNYTDLKKITFMFFWLTGMCTSCFLGIFQPFMRLWVGEKFLMGFSVVVCLCVYFYLYETTRLLNVFKNAGGIWHEDRFRPLISAIVNLALNLISVNYIGIYGIVLSTIVALAVIEIPWLLQNIFTVMYDTSLFKDYFKMFVSWIIATVFSGIIIAVLTYKVTFSGWGAFAFFVVVSVLIPNIVFLLLMHKTEEFKLSISMVNRITHNKLPIIKNL